MRAIRSIILVCFIALAGQLAHAGDEAYDGAPPPDEAGGVLVPRDTSAERWRWAPRIALYPVALAWRAIWAPPRLGMWAFDRYQVKDRLRQIFFNESGTAGVFPVAFMETGFGLNVGGRFILRDLLGDESRFRMRASYGGRFRQLYSAKYSTGELFGSWLELELLGELQLFPKSRFAGLGNADLQSFVPLTPVNALADDTAVETRFRHDDWRVELAAIAHLAPQWSVRGSGSVKSRDFDRDADNDDAPEVHAAYDTSGLVGYEQGLRNLYSELQLTYDSRRTTQFYYSPAAPSVGWKVDLFAGYQQGLVDHDPSSHARWGVDVQRYINLFAGDRVLILRGYVEGVTGELAEIPFVDLPTLGGPHLLRGYARDRFRDRNLTLFTAEYDYPVERNFGAYLFVDTGRVWRDLEDFSLDEFRVGFGGGLQMHTTEGFLARMFVASSVDGGAMFNLSFDPVFDVRSREESP